MSLVRSLSTSSLLRSRYTAYLADFGVQPELLYWKYERGVITSLVDAEGEGGHREITAPCRTMVTFGMQFPDLLELALKLRCHAVALPPTTVHLMLVR